MAQAKFIETETVDQVAINWFEIDGREYALTGDGKILDSEGRPLTDSDHETIRVRNAIKAAA
jgi:hypothetical protein